MSRAGYMGHGVRVRGGVGVGVVVAALGVSQAAAQEVMHTEAATMPSPGTGVIRPQFHVYEYGTRPGSDEKSVREYEALTRISYGLARAWAVSLDVPVRWTDTLMTDGTREDDEGVGDIDAVFKCRVYRDDSDPISTLRAVVLAGAGITSGDARPFGSQSVNPKIGGALTMVRGRWGFNQDVIYTFNTGGRRETNMGGEGPDDALAYNSAVVYRVWPPRFSSETHGAWYVFGEVNGLYETNGDNELRFTPGVMYEGRRWSAEVVVQLPLADSLDHRPELDWAVGGGLRISF
ncbi:MAG: hypothetical protein KF859_05725 [Phycisphaeraceae bacterium]|nr:hypothetical protein [Phycisphaeraceae bacterium]